MNTGILKKVIEELAKSEPKLDYIRGMLETLYEMGNSSTVEHPVVTRQAEGSNPSSPAPVDEASILDAHARAAIAAVQTMTTLDEIPPESNS